MNEKDKEKYIRQLLDRFMAGTTTLEEEEQLGAWFRSHPHVADDLKDYQAMFGYFDEGMPLDKTAENEMEANGMMEANKAEVVLPTAQTRMRRLWLPLSIAASIALLLVLAIPRMGHLHEEPMAQLDASASQEKADSSVDHKQKSVDTYLSMPEKVKMSADSATSKPVIRRQKRYRQHLYAPAPPRVLIAQDAVTDSLLAEPEMLADAHLREMEEQQNEMFFKLYLINALQMEKIHADIASASFLDEENVHDEDHADDDQEVY